MYHSTDVLDCLKVFLESGYHGVDYWGEFLPLKNMKVLGDPQFEGEVGTTSPSLGIELKYPPWNSSKESDNPGGPKKRCLFEVKKN